MSITVAQMIEMLQAMPQNAKLVITESGYYSYSEFADIMEPAIYIAESDEGNIAKGETTVRIGHSHQSY